MGDLNIDAPPKVPLKISNSVANKPYFTFHAKSVNTKNDVSN